MSTKRVRLVVCLRGRFFIACRRRRTASFGARSLSPPQPPSPRKLIRVASIDCAPPPDGDCGRGGGRGRALRNDKRV